MRLTPLVVLAVGVTGTPGPSPNDLRETAALFLDKCAGLLVSKESLRVTETRHGSAVTGPQGVAFSFGAATGRIRHFYRQHPLYSRKAHEAIEPHLYAIKSGEDAVLRASEVLRFLGIYDELKLESVNLTEHKLGVETPFEEAAIAALVFVPANSTADFLCSPPQVSLQFDRMDGRLFEYTDHDDQYRVDAEVRVSLDEARRIAERDLLQWHVPAAWRTVKSWREGHCMDVEERRESFLKRLPVPERAPAYPAYRFDLSSPEPSFIVVRATDGKVIARGLTGGGFGD